MKQHVECLFQEAVGVNGWVDKTQDCHTEDHCLLPVWNRHRFIHNLNHEISIVTVTLTKYLFKPKPQSFYKTNQVVFVPNMNQICSTTFHALFIIVTMTTKRSGTSATGTLLPGGIIVTMATVYGSLDRAVEPTIV